MLKPVGYRILIKPDAIETTTAGGIVVVVDERMEQAGINRGTVIDLGNHAFRAFSKDYTGEPWVHTGDKVVFARYAGREVEDPETGIKYQVMNDEDVICVIYKDTGATKKV